MMSAEPTSLEFLQAVYRNEQLPLTVRMRAAIEAAPYEHAKVPTALQLEYWNNDSFAAQLDRAIERAKHPPKMIDVTPVEQQPASVLKKPFPRRRV
jgi:hypothetical protein